MPGDFRYVVSTNVTTITAGTSGSPAVFASFVAADRVGGYTATITGATKANPCVITATAHGFTNGDYVKIADVGGMVELNNRVFVVANKATNTFQLSGIDSSGYTTYTSGGTAQNRVYLKAYSAPSKTFTLTYPVRPVELRALVVNFIVAAKTAEADYLFITGTDAWDAAQTESIDVSAGNGTYTSAKRWRTISNISCSDAADGTGTLWADGTLAVTQDIWGAIWDKGNSQYQIDSHFNYGNGSTATYFRSTREQVFFGNNVDQQIKANAVVQIGLYTAPYGYDGSDWNMYPASDVFLQGGTLLIYASHLHNRATMHYPVFNTGTITIKNSTLSSVYYDGGGYPWTQTWQFSYSLYGANVSLDEVWFLNSYGPMIVVTPALFRAVKSHKNYQGIYAQQVLTADALLISSACEIPVGVRSDWGGFTVTIKDPINALTTPLHKGTSAADLITREVYTCNVHLADKDGANLASASVACEYAHLVKGSDNQCYKCIQDHTAVDATHKPITGTDWASYWVLYSADGTLGGDWNTGFAYKSGTAEFATQTTDANGDITEQNIQYKKWVGASEILEARIHKFTYSKDGYPTLPEENIIVSRPIKWHKKLQRKAYINAGGLIG